MILVWLSLEAGRDGKAVLSGAARSAITAALQAKSAGGYSRTVGLVLGGPGTAGAAEEAAAFGLDEILCLEHPVLEHYSSLSYDNAMRRILAAEPVECLIGVSDSRGKDLLPRVAVFLDAAICTDVTEFLPGRRYRRPMYAGNITSIVLLDREKRVLSVRSSAFEKAQPAAAKTSIRMLELPVEKFPEQSFISAEIAASERPALGDAKAVVSGGRALKSKETFLEVLAPLADALGAALGASRAAVDSGYAPNDWQVGQTGKIVAPQLYVAVGISGAIQHLAGMKDAKVIVAINSDAEAPMLEVADYSLVGDLFEIVPQIVEELKKSAS